MQFNILHFYKMMWILLLCLLAWTASCHQNYCDICENHTMCTFGQGTGQRCGQRAVSSVSSTEIETILQVHNAYRRRVAIGNETRGLLGLQLPAANMHALVWDESLAKVAQRWADQCTLLHDECRDDARFPVGQNIYWSSGITTANWTRAIETWYNEVDFVSPRVVENFTSLGSKYQIGHYAQVVWAKTRYVGCGRRSYMNSYRLRGSNSLEFILSDTKKSSKVDEGKGKMKGDVQVDIKQPEKTSEEELGFFGGKTFDSYGAEGALTHPREKRPDSKNLSTSTTYAAQTPYYSYSGYTYPQLFYPSLGYTGYVPYYPYTDNPTSRRYTTTGSTDDRGSISKSSSESRTKRPDSTVNEENQRNMATPYTIIMNGQYYDLSNDQILICNYGPTGNSIGQPIYETGPPCSKCSASSVCQNGLCT